MDYVQEFLDFCQYQRCLSENTVASYKWDIGTFTQWLKERALEITTLKIRDIDSYIISQRKEGKSISTVNRHIVSLKMFFRYLQRIEVIEKNPFDFMTNIRAPKRLPRFLSLEEQERLIEASASAKPHRKYNKHNWTAWLGYRDKLMVLLLLDGGLRISELCAVRKSDIDLDQGVLRVIGKGDKERQVILSDRVLELIKKCPVMKSDLLFLNLHGKTLGSRHAFRLLKELGKKAGIPGIYPHLLRHSFASNLRRKGADLLLMREALGHSSVSTTQIYASISNEDYKAQMKGYLN